MIDVGAADHERVHQRQQLAAREGTADPAGEADGVVDQPLQAEAQDQHADQGEARVGDQVLVVEGRLGALDHMRR